MRKVFLLLAAMLFIPLMCMTASAALSDPYTELPSDEWLFGKWNGTSWTAAGKLTHTPGSAWSAADKANYNAVWDAVKAGSYTLAKEKLLIYYQNRTHNWFSSKPGGNAARRFQTSLTKNGLLYYTNNGLKPITKKDFTATPRYVEFNAKQYAAFVNGNGNFTFSLTANYNGESEVTINSREASVNRPQLVVTTSTGTWTFEPTKDTYIRAGGSKDANYGAENSLKVRAVAPTATRIFGDHSAMAYLNFRVAGISGTISAVTLRLYGSSASDKTSVIVWGEPDTSWTEGTRTWSNAQICYVNFTGCAGGVDWKLLSSANEPGLWGSFSANIARCYWLTNLANNCYANHGEYYAEISALIEDFITDAEFGDGDRPDYPNHDLIIAIRTRELITSFHSLLPYMSAQDCAKYLKWLWLLEEYLDHDSHFRANHNWGTFELYAYARVATVFTEFNLSPAWVSKSVLRFGQMIDALFNETDGSYVEGTSHYGIDATNNLLAVNNELEAAQVSLSANNKGKLTKALEYLVNLEFPNGYGINYGDDNGSGQPDYEAKINKWADSTESKNRLLYIDTHGVKGNDATLDYTSKAYLAGGNQLVIMRNGWDASSLNLYINNGAANGLSHTHPDNQSIVAYGYGSELLVDVGSYDYDDKPMSNWMRYSTEAHNTISVAGKEQSRTVTDPVETFLTNDSFDYYRATSKAIKDASGSFQHTRNIFFLRKADGGFWFVNDVVVPPNNSAYTYNQNWHLYPGGAPTYDNGTAGDDGKWAKTNFAGRANIMIAQALKESSVSLVSDSEKMKTTASGTLENDIFPSFSVTKTGNVVYNTLLYPQEPGTTDTFQVRNIATNAPSTDVASASQIVINGKPSYFYIANDWGKTNTAARAFGDFTYQGEAVYIDMSSDVKTVDVIDGMQLSDTSRTLFTSDIPIKDLHIEWNAGTLKLQSSSMTAGRLTVYNARFYPPGEAAAVTFNGTAVSYALSDGMLQINETENDGDCDGAGDKEEAVEIRSADIYSENFESTAVGGLPSNMTASIGAPLVSGSGKLWVVNDAAAGKVLESRHVVTAGGMNTAAIALPAISPTFESGGKAYDVKAVTLDFDLRFGDNTIQKTLDIMNAENTVLLRIRADQDNTTATTIYCIPANSTEQTLLVSNFSKTTMYHFRVVVNLCEGALYVKVADSEYIRFDISGIPPAERAIGSLSFATYYRKAVNGTNRFFQIDNIVERVYNTQTVDYKPYLCKNGAAVPKPEAGSLTGKTYYANDSADPQEVTLLAAFYDSGGIVRQIAMTHKNIAPHTKELLQTNPVSITNTDGLSVKLFLWNNPQDMKVLKKPVEYK